jgi:hypothetical protein
VLTEQGDVGIGDIDVLAGAVDPAERPAGRASDLVELFLDMIVPPVQSERVFSISRR